MALHETPSTIEDVQQWRSDEIYERPPESVVIPPELMTPGYNILMYDFWLPVAHKVRELTHDTLSGAWRLDTQNAQDSILLPNMFIAIQDGLTLSDSRIVVRDTQWSSLPGNYWETEMNCAFQFNGIEDEQIIYFRWCNHPTKGKELIAVHYPKSMAGIEFLSRKINFIEPRGMKLLRERFLVPDVKEPDKPPFPFTRDNSVVFAFGFGDQNQIKELPGVFLSHVWIADSKRTILIDGFEPDQYVQYVSGIRKIEQHRL